MHEAELLEFLFLPGFTTAKVVTEFSGRGVGLDVVQDTIRKVGGSVRVTTQFGRGTTFHLQLPLTLSVIRAVLVDVAGEPYAFPHNRIDRLIRVPRAEVRSLEHRQFVTVDGQNVGLVVAAQLLDLPAAPAGDDDLAGGAAQRRDRGLRPGRRCVPRRAGPGRPPARPAARQGAEPRAPRRSSTTARRC